LVVEKKSKKIICTSHSRGKTHDLKLFQRSKIKLKKKTKMQLDLGYLGMEKFHKNVQLPKKSSKYYPLTRAERQYNKRVSSSRVLVEHVIGKVKVFRIMAEKYRNRRKRHSLRMQLICSIYNRELCK
jgi:hypothetical protein